MRRWPPESVPVRGDTRGDDGPSWVLIRYCLALWSIFCVIVGLAEQIAGTLRNRYPDEPEKRVSHETIYNALYVMPKGELRTELLGCLRQARRIRRPRARGEDRRGQIQDMVSLHVRPPEVEDRLIPGHWEGDLIKGAFSRSAVGTWQRGSNENTNGLLRQYLPKGDRPDGVHARRPESDCLANE